MSDQDEETQLLITTYLQILRACKITNKNEIIYGVYKKIENLLDGNKQNAIKTATICIQFQIC
jgi:hypothetical protein